MSAPKPPRSKIDAWRIAERWDKDSVSWLAQPALAPPHSHGIAQSSPLSVFRIDVSAIVRFWLRQPLQNRGLALKAPAGDGHGVTFATGASDGNAPRLELYVRLALCAEAPGRCPQIILDASRLRARRGLRRRSGAAAHVRAAYRLRPICRLSESPLTGFGAYLCRLRATARPRRRAQGSQGANIGGSFGPTRDRAASDCEDCEHRGGQDQRRGHPARGATAPLGFAQ